MMENRIRERIKESGMTQKELAKKLDITTVGLNQIASADMPKIGTFIKVAAAMGVPVWSLMLSDAEIEEICSSRSSTEAHTFPFRCPECGAQFNITYDKKSEEQ